MNNVRRGASIGELESAPKNNKLNILLKKANIPSLPIVAQKLLELCSDDLANFTDFARVIQSDPGLSSRLIRMSNSAYYGLRNKVTSIDRAISALGLNHVKSICLGFHLVTALNTNRPDGFDISKYWQQSVLRGALARQIADIYHPACRDEAFLTGLLQDCGIPLLAQALGEKYGVAYNSKNSHAAFYQMEKQLFDCDHIAIVRIITDAWQMPELLTLPIIHHHHRGNPKPASDKLECLQQIAYFVATLPLNNPEYFCDEDYNLPEYALETFGVCREQLQIILLKAKSEFDNIAGIFSNVLGGDVNISDIITEARDLLIELESNNTQKLISLESEIFQLQNQCQNLNQDLVSVRQTANTDDLTGLALRSVINRHINDQCKAVELNQSALTLFFIDIDNFKRFNDLYGHDIGDQALVCISGILSRLFDDLGCVARYGGDEFIVAVTVNKIDNAVDLARKLVAEVREAKINIDDKDKQIDVTCSVGMVHCESGSDPHDFKKIQEIADRKMYEAKNGGKNNFCHQILSAVPAKDLI